MTEVSPETQCADDNPADKMSNLPNRSESDWFSRDYAEARALFLATCEHAGARMESFPYQGGTDSFDALFVDTASLGPQNPERALVIISGTHGVEGFCGSACQSFWLGEAMAGAVDRIDGLGVFLVHALNPYGFAECRRVTHENVDLNRNFIDFAGSAPPANAEYAELEELLNPRGLNESSLNRLDPSLAGWFASKETIARLKAAVGRGQYDYPKGMIYGGGAPSWCNKLLRQFISKLPGGIRAGVVVDIHTGLGERGGLEVFTEDSGAKFHRVAGWLPSQKVTTLGDPESLGYEITGSLFRAFTAKDDPTSPWHCLALEFGTVPIPQVLLALQADNWLHCFATERSSTGRVRSMMKDAFYVSAPDWQSDVLRKTTNVIKQLITGLNEPR